MPFACAGPVRMVPVQGGKISFIVARSPRGLIRSATPPPPPATPQLLTFSFVGQGKDRKERRACVASYSILTTLLIKQFQQVEACFRISAGADPSLSLPPFLPPSLPPFLPTSPFSFDICCPPLARPRFFLSFPFQRDGFHSVQARKALLWRYSATLTFVFFNRSDSVEGEWKDGRGERRGLRDLWLPSRWRATECCQVQKLQM